ncbi:MAG: TlpA family protein disulfide reductase [Pseudohongiellaceae bacterium]
MKISSITLGLLSCLFLMQTATAEPADKFKPLEAETFSEIKQSNSGHAFLVSLWSIDCAPCRLELALLGDLKKTNPQFPLVLISTDSLEERETANYILEEYSLEGLVSWMFADNFIEPLRYSIDPNWYGELPRTYLYDANHVATAHSGVLTPELLEDFQGMIP